MDESSAMVIFWTSGFIGFVITLIGVLYILTAIRRLSGRLKIAMIFLLFTVITFAFSNLGYGLIVISKNLPSKLIFLIVPLFLTSSVLFTFAAIKLLSVLMEKDVDE